MLDTERRKQAQEEIYEPKGWYSPSDLNPPSRFISERSWHRHVYHSQENETEPSTTHPIPYSHPLLPSPLNNRYQDQTQQPAAHAFIQRRSGINHSLLADGTKDGCYSDDDSAVSSQYPAQAQEFTNSIPLQSHVDNNDIEEAEIGDTEESNANSNIGGNQLELMYIQQTSFANV